MPSAIPPSSGGPPGPVIARWTAARRRPARTAARLAVVVLAGGLAACGGGATASTTPSIGPPDCAPSAPRITVAASGQAAATPDTLTISLGVQVTDSTAAAALSDANGQATTLTGSLGASGVAPSNVRSTDFSIVPTFTLTGRISGYQVSNVVLVTLHDLSHAGQTIDAAVASVGNAIRINGLTYSVSKTGNVDGRARADAVVTADAHAHSMARAAAASLHGVCSISDTTISPAPLTLPGTAFNASAAVPNQSVPLEPGTQQATALVTVVYALGVS